MEFGSYGDQMDMAEWISGFALSDFNSLIVTCGHFNVGLTYSHYFIVVFTLKMWSFLPSSFWM